MAHDREVGGIRCTEVLALLSDYLDHEVAAAARHTIEAHLRGCDWCEQFGAEMTDVVTALRRELGAPSSLDAGTHARLLARLADELG